MKSILGFVACGFIVLAAPCGASASPLPDSAQEAVSDSQRRVWEAEEAVVSVLAEQWGLAVRFGQLLEDHPSLFPGIDDSEKASFAEMMRNVRETQGHLVSLGVLRPALDGAFLFAYQGRAPSAIVQAAAVQHDLAVQRAMDSPAVKKMDASLERNIPPELAAPYAELLKSNQVLQLKAYRVVEAFLKAIDANGGRFNSRWGLFLTPGASLGAGQL